MPRQRRARARSRVARARATRDRGSARRRRRGPGAAAPRASATRRRDLADDADRRRRPPARRSPRSGRHEERLASPARSAASTPSASQSCSTTPFTSKKSTSRARPDQCSARAPRRSSAHGQRRAFRRSRCDEARSPISNSATSRRPCRRLCATASTRPRRRGAATAAACRTWPTAGWRRATTGRRPAVANARRRLRFDEPERDRFGQTGGGQHPPHQLIARDARIGRRRRRGHDGERRLELVEAVVAADFLDEIDFAQQIDAERRRHDVPAVGGRRDRQARGRAGSARRRRRGPRGRAAARAARGAGAASAGRAAPG